MKNKKKKTKRVFPVIPPMASPFDPLGSWTGTYLLGEFEEPDQDVDDL